MPEIIAPSRGRRDAAAVLTSERNRFEAHITEQGTCLRQAEQFVAFGDFRKARDCGRLALRAAEAASAAYNRWLDAADLASRDYGTYDPEGLLRQA